MQGKAQFFSIMLVKNGTFPQIAQISKSIIVIYFSEREYLK
jgi:hypothetical protein